MDPSKSLFVIAIYAFTETICQALQKYTVQSNVFCPYGAHSSSRGRHVETNKQKRKDSFQNNVMIQRGHFYRRR